MKIENNDIVQLLDEGAMIWSLGINFIVCVIFIAIIWFVVSQFKIAKKFIKPLQISLSLILITVTLVKIDKDISVEFHDSYRLIQELKKTINTVYSSNNIRYTEVNEVIKIAMQDNIITLKEWGGIKSEFISVAERAQKQIPRYKEEMLAEAQVKSKEELIKQYKRIENE